jgi:hypothetical protein
MSKKPDHATSSAGTFRPSSYWEDNNPLAAILRNVKSTNRRQMITDYWNAGRLEELFPENLSDDPGPGAQQFLERIHPSFMGGAYLPELLPTEVEIARIELKSTTSDVISIRARHGTDHGGTLGCRAAHHPDDAEMLPPSGLKGRAESGSMQGKTLRHGCIFDQHVGRLRLLGK